MSTPHTLSFRVAYSETDGQRRVHHANYLNYFERGRVEYLRSLGWSYKAIEDSGLLLVVSEINVQYFMPAEFDDVLTLETSVLSAKGARIRHAYRLTREETLIVTAESTIACIDRTGRVRRLPAELRTSG
ncbi:acyl-CoA thioesterase [Planctomycetaceae bacterium SH139]